MTEQDLDYFATRLAQEESAAGRAASPAAAAAHNELALRYRMAIDAHRTLGGSSIDSRAA